MANQNLPSAITPPAGYYNRFDEADRYDRHLFRADYVLQAPELNEIQERADHQTRKIADALFKDGAIISGCQLLLTDAGSNNATAESGVIYIEGAMRGVPSLTFTVPMTGTITVGIYLIYGLVTPTEDPGILDPSVGLQNFSEPGAFRLSKTPQWGYEGQPSPPANSAFYPIYEIVDGIVQPKDPPPDINAVSLAIARYDVQSTGSQYIANGMTVSKMADSNGQQVYLIDAGTARINGREIIYKHSYRSFYDAIPDLDSVSAESHSATTSPQTITLNHPPIDAVTLVLITRNVTTETVTRGQTPGGADGLAHTSILSVSEVKQGGTTYTSPADYTLTNDQISWAPGGAEPAGGSTYTVTYRYTAVYPDEPDIVSAETATTVTIVGAVSGTTILIGYNWKMPRYDRMGMTDTGNVIYVKGVSHPTQPVVPRLPDGVLPLATIYQTWTESTRRVIEDSVRMVPMNSLNSMQRRIDDLFSLVGDLRLAINLTQRDPTTKRGLFVDAFYDNDLRDAGLAQTAVTTNETLTLGMDFTVHQRSQTGITTLPETTPVIALQQRLWTNSTPINPYMAFAPMPGRATLTPAVDFWTETQDIFANTIINHVYLPPDVTSYVRDGQAYSAVWGPRTNDKATLDEWWEAHRTIISEANEWVAWEPVRQIGSTQTILSNLRQTVVQFDLVGFGSGEILTSVVFDGISVPFRATP